MRTGKLAKSDAMKSASFAGLREIPDKLVAAAGAWQAIREAFALMCVRLSVWLSNRASV